VPLAAGQGLRSARRGDRSLGRRGCGGGRGRGGRRGRRGRAHDGLIGLEDGLIVGQHPAQGRLGARPERGRPDLRRDASEMVLLAQPVQPGQRPVDTTEPQVSAEEREPDRGLAKERVEEGGI
jgi:hypothetical protein